MAADRRIEDLPAGDRVKAYKDLGNHFWAMAALAHIDATKLTFVELAQEMYERADAVTVLAA